MSEKILSIIIPSYNMEKYLDRCLSSLIVDDAALLAGLDVIVVNDGSKDRTSEIAHKYEAEHPGAFRVIDKPNGNYGSCINAGLPLVRGKYVRILDADDCFRADNLAAYLKYLQGIEDVDMVLSDTENVNDKSGVVETCCSYKFEPKTKLAIEQVLESCVYLNMNTIAYRSAIFEGLCYRQTEGISYTDTQWSILPLARVRTVHYYPEVIYRYSVSRDGQTMEEQTAAKNFWMFARSALDIARQYMKIRDTLTVRHLELMDKRVIRFASRAYNCPYKKVRGVRYDIDLPAYDEELRRISQWIYDEVGKTRFGRPIPCRCAANWRRHDLWGLFVLLSFAASRDAFEAMASLKRKLLR